MLTSDYYKGVKWRSGVTASCSTSKTVSYPFIYLSVSSTNRSVVCVCGGGGGGHGLCVILKVGMTSMTLLRVGHFSCSCVLY